MAFSKQEIYIVLLIIFVIKIECKPGVENYQSRHSKTFQQKQKSFQYEVGWCKKTNGKYVCCDGYVSVESGKKCVPDCDCKNGYCRAPGICVCQQHFVKSLAGQCVNTCPFGCLNGVCDPYTYQCKCNVGYIPSNNNTICVPWCNMNCGQNGNCTAPNKCECKVGYKRSLDNVTCEPHCYPPCGHGTCISPGKCHCAPGYKLKDGTCQANCTSACKNGRCIANNFCECNDGYQKVNQKCEPHCSVCPERERCVKPNKCDCLQGYKRNNKGICKPICERGCNHGTCQAPNDCRCNAGYILFNGKCEKVTIPRHTTKLPPRNQTRLGNNSWSSYPVRNPQPIPQPSYQPLPPSHPIRVPQPVYHPKPPAYSNQNIKPTVQSIPICNPPCVNGNCTGNNNCTCYANYIKDMHRKNMCNPICHGCINGFCQRPNVCSCRSGYILINGRCDIECKDGIRKGDQCVRHRPQ